MTRMNVVIADDQPLFIKGLQSLLAGKSSNYTVLATYQDGEELLHSLELTKADVLILDLSLLNKDGLEVIKEIKNREQAPGILVFSRYAQSSVVKSAFQHGADGYLLKSDQEDAVLTALHHIIEGKTYLGTGVHLKKQTRKRYGRRNGRRSFEERFIRKYDLTKRELEVLKLITEALSNKEIAQSLFISAQTVSVHRKNIMRKLGVSNTAGIMKAAYEDNLV